MKISSLFFIVLITTSLLSCSGDNESFDDSGIKGRSFKLSSYKLSQPVDLNRDGLTSTDMVNEFDSLKVEEIRFFDNNQIMFSRVDLRSTVSSESGTNYMFSPNNSNFFGSYQMLGQNSVEVEIIPFPGGLGEMPYKVRYTIDPESNQLIQSSNLNFPTTYNPTTKTWINTTVQITKMYNRN